MANKEHLKILKQGVDAWNKWRIRNPEIHPDLSRARLYGVDLSWANLNMTNFSKALLPGAVLREAGLNGANFNGAYLPGSVLYEAYLRGAKLIRANLCGVKLRGALLTDADLRGADLSWAFLDTANLGGVDLSNANLMHAHLVWTNFENATLTNCRIYGISAWGLKLKDAVQKDLVITPEGGPTITVDNLEVAQFIYLLLYNEKIRHVIDTITSKVVLILGRFNPPERKAVLDAIKEELRKHNYLPVLFDFEKPASRDFTETISTLAHLSRFVIVDVTEPKSVPHELQAIIPTLAVPIQPLIQSSSKEYGMFSNFKKYHWVLKIYRYDSLNNLLASFDGEVIKPAEARAKELLKSKKRRL